MGHQIGRGERREARLQVTDNITMHYAVYGTKESALVPLICLPGYWRNSRDFEELARHQGDRRQVITPDLRGRGRTDRSQRVEDYAFERLVDDVLLLMEVEEIASAVFCGTALGAQIGLSLSLTHPEKVAGLILNDTGLEPASDAATSRMVSFATGDAQEFDQVLEKTQEQYSSQFPSFGGDEWRRMALRAYRQLPEGGWVRDFDQLTNDVFPEIKAAHPDWWKEFRAAHSVPLAIIRGENSAYLSEDMANRMVEDHPRSVLYTIMGSGHAPTLWEAQSLSAIDEFLFRVDSQ